MMGHQPCLDIFLGLPLVFSVLLKKRSSYKREEDAGQSQANHFAEYVYNPKLVRLSQVPHRASKSEGSTLARRKWQPPHNVGTPQTMNILTN